MGICVVLCQCFDNNEGKDYHTHIWGGAHLSAMEDSIYKSLVEGNAAKDAGMADQVGRKTWARVMKVP